MNVVSSRHCARTIFKRYILSASVGGLYEFDGISKF